MREKLATDSKKQTKKASKTIARLTYPQKAAVKRSLLCRNLPWRLDASEILEHLARLLLHGGLGIASSGGPSSVRLRATNCGAFSANDSVFGSAAKPISSLVVEAERNGETKVVQEPSSYFPRRAGIGAVVLRFQRFEDAYLARRRF